MIFGHFSHDSSLNKKYSWSTGQVVKVLRDGGRAPQGWTLTTPWDIYKVSFNGCDLFNKELRKFRWPFLHHAHNGLSAEENIADFIEAVALQNSFNAWTSLHESDESMSYYTFLIELSKELYQLALAKVAN